VKSLLSHVDVTSLRRLGRGAMSLSSFTSNDAAETDISRDMMSLT
jgi:hypothetical protein